jgi:hypothetical protein
MLQCSLIRKKVPVTTSSFVERHGLALKLFQSAKTTSTHGCVAKLAVPQSRMCYWESAYSSFVLPASPSCHKLVKKTPCNPTIQEEKEQQVER